MATFKPINPKPLNITAANKVIRESMNKIADDIQIDYQVSVADFNKKVKFNKSVTRIASGMRAFVYYQNQIMQWVDEGTRGPYVIVARNSRVLAFQPNYTRKTVPNTAESRPGGASGDTVFRPYVVHPGIEAANITKELARHWRVIFPKRMREAMTKIVLSLGHKI